MTDIVVIPCMKEIDPRPSTLIGQISLAQNAMTKIAIINSPCLFEEACGGCSGLIGLFRLSCLRSHSEPTGGAEGRGGGSFGLLDRLSLLVLGDDSFFRAGDLDLKCKGLTFFRAANPYFPVHTRIYSSVYT